MADKFGMVEIENDSPVLKIFRPSTNFDSKSNEPATKGSTTAVTKSIQSSNQSSVQSSVQPSTSSGIVSNQIDKRKSASTNVNRGSITVNERHRGNPLLKAFQINSYYFDKIIPDYILGSTCCALFLSLKYHNMYPQYIYGRMNAIGSSYGLKVLVLLIDILDANHSLKEMIKICSLADFSLMCAWSFEDAGRILDTYKCFEHKSPESIMDKKITGKTSRYQCNLDALSSIKTINKTDSLSLLSTFGTLENLIKSSKRQLELCVGLGPTKAEVLSNFFNKPFKRKF